MAKLQVNMEEVTFYDIDDSAIPFDEEVADAEVLRGIEAANNKFINEVINLELLKISQPCQCRMAEFMNKHQKRAALLGGPPNSYVPALDQEDVDAYKFGIIVRSIDGYIKSIEGIIRECRGCHKIDFWGNSAVFTRLMAESFRNYMESTHENEETSADGNSNPLEEMSDGGDYKLETLGE